MSIYSSLLHELQFVDDSKDYSIIDDNFKQKSGKQFKIIDIQDKSILNINCIKNNQKIYNDIKYKIESEKLGEIAIDNKTQDFAGYVIINKSGIIGPLYIEKEYRGYGLSNTFMNDAVKKYNGKKLGVYSDNQIAINLYKKFGFEITETKTYSDGTKVYIMELKGK